MLKRTSSLAVHTASTSIPVVDLFAGPGGLSEGFSSFRAEGFREPVFEIVLSIEKDPIAHRTLELRAIFRHLARNQVPDVYYRYLRGEIERTALLLHPSVREAAKAAAIEARCATLGETPDATIDKWVQAALHNRGEEFVLIGGPPCQAYSLVGRSRMAKVERDVFERDHRHLLYREYLRIISKFKPAVFVMENVKGILSAKLGGRSVFDLIRADLSKPGGGLEYEIRSFVHPEWDSLKATDYVIQAERYGVPQARHRVILFGIRRDFAGRAHEPLKPQEKLVTVEDLLRKLPALRSSVSRGENSQHRWIEALARTPAMMAAWPEPMRRQIVDAMGEAIRRAQQHEQCGGRFVRWKPSRRAESKLETWLHDSRLEGLPNHEARRHMTSDLQRYLFAASYAKVFGVSPKLRDFPSMLLPSHSNVNDREVPFEDRFRVQLWSRPATTVVSHIAKDGHYFIHPDPSQARSLTVREAARLQTFPDNYFFEGNRTEQYTQVGNAVPPYLAVQLASVVSGFLLSTPEHSEASVA